MFRLLPLYLEGVCPPSLQQPPTPVLPQRPQSPPGLCPRILSFSTPGNLPTSTSISASSSLKYSGSSELPGVAGQLQAGPGGKLRSELSHWLGTLSPTPLPPFRIPTGLSFPRPVSPACSHRDAAGPPTNQPAPKQSSPSASFCFTTCVSSLIPY